MPSSPLAASGRKIDRMLPVCKLDRERVALAIGSHGLLDTLAEGGRAIPLFWPLTGHRFAAPLRLFPDAPRGFAFISRHGLAVAALEFLYFLPVTAFALWPRTPKGRPRLQILDGGAERPAAARAPRAATAEIPAEGDRRQAEADREPTIPPSMRSTG